MLSGLSSTIRTLDTIHLSGGKKHASGGRWTRGTGPGAGRALPDK